MARWEAWLAAAFLVACCAVVLLRMDRFVREHDVRCAGMAVDVRRIADAMDGR